MQVYNCICSRPGFTYKNAWAISTSLSPSQAVHISKLYCTVLSVPLSASTTVLLYRSVRLMPDIYFINFQFLSVCLAFAHTQAPKGILSHIYFLYSGVSI